MKNIKLNRNKKIIIIILLIPLLFISQYYFFKLGIFEPQIKGIDVYKRQSLNNLKFR